MSHAVEIDAAVKSFGAQRAVDELSLAVPEGSIYGFIGPNGSGKTTTLRLILRILQPDAGRVTVLGQSHGAVADDRLGYLPEERGLYKRMKVADAIEYFARLKGATDCRPALRGWLERLGAADWADKRIDALSKGMAQKVQFVVAVIARPQLLILDEPFSGLDPVNLEVLKEAVFELRRQGTTIIFSTHDMHVAEQMCDTILMIFRGRKVLDGTLAEIQRQHQADMVRVRLVGGAAPPADLPQIASIAPSPTGHLIRLAAGHQSGALLRGLLAGNEVEHFELVRPSLHDIFVQIARPASNGEEAA